MHISDHNCPFCPIYENLKERLFTDIEVLSIGFSYPQDKNFLFLFLLNNPIISDTRAKYIRLAMELRDLLMNKHRTND